MCVCAHIYPVGVGQMVDDIESGLSFQNCDTGIIACIDQGKQEDTRLIINERTVEKLLFVYTTDTCIMYC